jgi:hypothetical protein
MAKVIDDLKFVLEHHRTELGPYYMARIANALGDMGYKNTDLIRQ